MLIVVAVLCLPAGLSKRSEGAGVDGSLNANAGVFSTMVSTTGRSTYEVHWSVEWPVVVVGGIALCGGLVVLLRRPGPAPRTA